MFSEACAPSFFRLLPRPLQVEGQLGVSITHPPRAHDVMLTQPCAVLGFHFLICEVVPLTPVILSHRDFMRMQQEARREDSSERMK